MKIRLYFYSTIYYIMFSLLKWIIFVYFRLEFRYISWGGLKYIYVGVTIRLDWLFLIYNRRVWTYLQSNSNFNIMLVLYIVNLSHVNLPFSNLLF